MKVTLRPARASDQSAIRRLIKEGNINPFGLDWRRFVVAVDQEQRVIGCGQLKPHGNNTVELASIAVTAAVRGRGVARQLIDHLLASHAPPIWLMCAARLEPFYVPFGFERVRNWRKMPRYFRPIALLANLFGRNALAIMVWRG